MKLNFKLLLLTLSTIFCFNSFAQMTPQSDKEPTEQVAENKQSQANVDEVNSLRESKGIIAENKEQEKVQVKNNEEEHKKLRELMNDITKATNEQKIDEINKYLADKFIITFITQETAINKEDLTKFFTKWVSGPTAFVKKYTVTPKADSLTEIYDDKYGVVKGTSVEKYELSNGKEYTLNVKWTATVIKDGENWKILTLHNGVDVTDNPILKSAADLNNIGLWAAIFGFVGAFIGCIIGIKIGKRK